MPAAIPKALRSVLAVLAGFALMISLVIACNLLATRAMNIPGHPTPGYLVVSAAFSLLAAVAGGWLAARLSGYNPMHHALALAMLLGLLSLAMLIEPSPAQPYGYQLLMAALPPFAALTGGYLAARRMRHNSTA
jgi:hypothetical protein